MSDIADAAKVLFQRVGDFFDLFDLSFLVSGAGAVGAFVLWHWLKTDQLVLKVTTVYQALMLAVACYLSGLVCFTAGRKVRWLVFRIVRRTGRPSFDRYQALATKLRHHDLSAHPKLQRYLTDAPSADTTLDEEQRERRRWLESLYTRLWAELRQDADLAPSFNLARRYWVLAATYDGLTTVLLLWLAIVLRLELDGSMGAVIQLSRWELLGVGTALSLLALFCAWEARRYDQYQLEEVVASLATRKAPAAAEKPPEPTAHWTVGGS